MEVFPLLKILFTRELIENKSIEQHKVQKSIYISRLFVCMYVCLYLWMDDWNSQLAPVFKLISLSVCLSVQNVTILTYISSEIDKEYGNGCAHII